MWAVADGDGVVEMLINDDTAAFHCASPALFVDLEDHIIEFDGIIPIDCPFGLDREHPVEIGAATRDKSCLLWLCGLDRKPFIELADIASL